MAGLHPHPLRPSPLFCHLSDPAPCPQITLHATARPEALAPGLRASRSRFDIPGRLPLPLRFRCPPSTLRPLFCCDTLTTPFSILRPRLL